MDTQPTLGTAALSSDDSERASNKCSYSAMGLKPRVLAVDDARDTLTLLRLFLSANGFEVVTAPDVPAALLCLQEQLPDLVITDYAICLLHTNCKPRQPAPSAP